MFILAGLRCFLGPLEPILGRLGTILGGLGRILGRSWGDLGMVLGHLGEVFGASWGGLGPLGAVLGRLGSENTLIFLVFFNTFWKTDVLSKHVHLGRSWAFLRPA